MLTEHRTLQPSLNRDTADDFRATKALADASACLVDRRVCLSPALLAWVALEALALKWNFGWKGVGPHRHRLDAGGHRAIPQHLISPPPNSGIPPAPPDRLFPAPTREEQGRAAPQAGLPG